MSAETAKTILSEANGSHSLLEERVQAHLLEAASDHAIQEEMKSQVKNLNDIVFIGKENSPSVIIALGYFSAQIKAIRETLRLNFWVLYAFMILNAFGFLYIIKLISDLK